MVDLELAQSQERDERTELFSSLELCRYKNCLSLSEMVVVLFCLRSMNFSKNSDVHEGAVIPRSYFSPGYKAATQQMTAVGFYAHQHLRSKALG